MSQTIFIAYARKDASWKEKVEIHLRVLEGVRDVEVWSDKEIGTGEYWQAEIEAAIARARVAILLISANFLTSKFITRKEVPSLLKLRAKSGLPVIPILVRHCAWKKIDWLSEMQIKPGGNKPLAGHSPNQADKVLAEMAEGIAELLEPASPPTPKSSASLPTPKEIDRKPLRVLPGGGLALPCFFPSVSSAAKTLLSPLDHMKTLVGLEHPCFLASAYDFVHASRSDRLKMTSLIDRTTENGQVVLLDSGLYERKWRYDSKWSRSQFHATAAGLNTALGFFFDDVKAKDNNRETAIAIAKKVRSDRRKIGLESLFPIVHAEVAELPELCKEVALALDSDIIAVAERELGQGLLAGAKTMIDIRRALDSTGRHRVVHILGTGNPLSILVYVACGADSFDGLDWCQTVVDYESKLLYHNQQLDFFSDQSRAARSDLGYPTRLLAHNLEFYRQWMLEIQNHMTQGKLDDLLGDVLPERFGNEFLTLLHNSAPADKS